MAKDTHRHERAKKLLAGKGTGVSDVPQTHTKKMRIGLSGAAPSTFPVKGASPKKRLDKRQRFADGGGVDGDMPKAKKGGAKTEVNIVIAGKGDQGARPVPVPVPVGGAPAPAMPPRPPMGAPGMMPPGGMPRPPMKRGGAVKMTAGAGGGEGRLEKVAAQKSTRKKGGK